MQKTIPSTLFVLAFFSLISWTIPPAVQAQSGDQLHRLYLPVIFENEPPQWIGPYGGKIVALASSQADPEIIFAGTWGSGVYKSFDGGNQWMPANTGLGSLYIQSLAVDPERPHIVFAGVYRHGLYKSTDGGATWSARSVHPSDTDIVPYAIAIDPTAPDIIYLGYRAVPQQGFYDPATGPWLGKILRSTDGGENWSVVLQNVRGEAVQDYPYDIAVHPNDGNQVYAAFHVSGPYKCVNGVWQQILDGNPSLAGRSIAIRPNSSPAVVYFGAWTSQNAYVNDNRGGIYIWENGIRTWRVASDDLIGKDIYPSYGVEVDPAHPDTLYSATWGSGLYTSSDNGLSWSNADVPWDTIYSVLPHPVQGTPVFVGTTDVGLYVGTPNAWTKAKLPGSPVTGIITDPANNQVLYASTAYGGVSKSIDQGVSWAPLNTYLGDTRVQNLVYHPGGKSMFALTESRGVFRYDLTAGLGWIASSGGLPFLQGSSPSGADSHFPSVETGTGPEPLALRLDGSIHPKSSRPEYIPVLSLAFDPRDPLIGYLGTAGSGIYKSQDGGSSWTFLGLASESIQQVVMSTSDPLSLYAVMANGMVQSSTDGGLSWIGLPLPGMPSVNTLALASSDASLRYAGTTDGIFRHNDDGTWDGPWLGDRSITSIAVHPSRSGTILVGTTSGAFLSIDQGETWQVAQSDLAGLEILTIQFEAGTDDPHWLYFATRTHGTLRTYFP